MSDDIIHDIGSAEDETNEFYHKWLDRKAEVEDLSRKLEEARMRIGGLEAELREVQSKSYNQYKCGFAHGCHQFRHDMAEAGHAEVANTISADLIEHYARDASENFHAKDARIASLESALKPFADESERWDESFDDTEPLYDNGFEQPAPTVGDLRRARNELEGSQTATEAQTAPEAPGAITEGKDG